MTDSRYLAFVRGFVSCLVWDDQETPVSFDDVEGYFPSVAHHVRWEGGGGMGLKPSDYRTVPLTDSEHRELHQMGEEAFWRRAGVDPRKVMVSLLLAWTKLDDVRLGPDVELPPGVDLDDVRLAVLLDLAEKRRGKGARLA